MSLTRAQRRLVLPAVLLCSLLLGACPARADIGQTIIQRCVHGQSLAGFRQADYRRALMELGADAEEYTNCASLIQAAQAAAATGRSLAGTAAGGAITPLLTSPAEQRSLSRAARLRAAPVRLGGRLVNPGVVHANIASALSSLPSPLLATIIFLLACLAIVGGVVAHNRFRGHRAD